MTIRIFTVVVLACLMRAMIAPPLACAEEWQFRDDQDPWDCKQERFVRDMILRWRDDYADLSVGEIRLKVHEVILGVKRPEDRYSIDTRKKGRITFKNVDGVICCNIEKP